MLHFHIYFYVSDITLLFRKTNTGHLVFSVTGVKVARLAH